jgi:hypothetical protein
MISRVEARRARRSWKKLARALGVPVAELLS